MAKKRVYDPRTKKWVLVDDKKDDPKKDDDKDEPKKDDSGMDDPKKDKGTTSDKTTEKVNKITLRTLSGGLSVVPNENTISIKSGNTIKLKGLGKYLSGKYYVETVERTYNSSGLSISATVLKTNFRKSLKVIAKYPDESSKLKDYDNIYKKNLEQYKKQHNGATPKTYVVKSKDTLYTISKHFYGTTKYASNLAKINGNLPKDKWTKLPLSYKLIIAKN